MDSPVLNRIFWQLFSAPARGCLYSARRNPPPSRSHLLLPQRRGYARGLRSKEDDGSGRSTWQQRLDYFPKDVSKQLKEFPRVTARELRHRAQRPKRVKMYTRDFIEDSLYNPHYGYFSKQATIFTPGKPFDFGAIADEAELNKLVNQSYLDFEDALDEVDFNENRQLWHTPTEFFQPHYGEAIARYLVHQYAMSLYPYHDLVIYEMGAGNGTLMRNILDYIRDNHPDIYIRTKFRVIEISSSLHSLQKTLLTSNLSDPDHLEHVELINSSIFDWTTPVSQPCFFIALEVIDNFGHDSIRYDPYTLTPLQGSILIDEDGEFYEFYEPTLDTLTTRYLKLRDIAARSTYHTPITHPHIPNWLTGPYRRWRHNLPLAPNLTIPEYIPTRLMQFFDVLSTYFPHHRLILSDFTSLPNTVAGINAPVVQTRHQRRNIPVTTPFVHQGYFDIFFPTDFEMMEDMYRLQTRKLTRVSAQGEWFQKWGRAPVRLGDGEDVLGSWYRNQSVMTTH